MKTPSKFSKRTGSRLVLGAACVLLALGTLSVWNKQDFCRGWANHYAARAKQLRAEAANPALKPEESREYLAAAAMHDEVSRKYAAVAWGPWRPYPRYPLATPKP